MTVVTNPAVKPPDDEATDPCTNNNSQTGQVVSVDSPSVVKPEEWLSEGISDDDNANIEARTRLVTEQTQSYLNLTRGVRCDIIFIAGYPGDNRHYAAHRSVLAAACSTFECLLDAKSELVIVDCVDRRGFVQLLRYCYGQEPRIQSAFLAKCTLDAAFKYTLPELVERCVRRLDEILSPSIAMQMLEDLRFMCSRLPGIASAPPPPELVDENAVHLHVKCTQWADALAHNVLLLLDEFADEALADERLESLSYESLGLLVKRPTFRVSDEYLLAAALLRWATAACKRQNRELTSGNLRTALGELSYTPRYLLMKGSRLEHALALELLEPVERRLVLAVSRKCPSPVAVGAEQEDLLRRWAVPRPTQPSATPIHLSSRSKPENSSSWWCAGRRKQKKAPPVDSSDEKDKNKKEGCCKCFGEGLLRAFICIFD